MKPDRDLTRTVLEIHNSEPLHRKTRRYQRVYEADERARTVDLLHGKQTLYQLSYIRAGRSIARGSEKTVARRSGPHMNPRPIELERAVRQPECRDGYLRVSLVEPFDPPQPMSLSEKRACVGELKRPLRRQSAVDELALKRPLVSMGTFGADVVPRPVPHAHTMRADFPVADTFSVIARSNVDLIIPT